MDTISLFSVLGKKSLQNTSLIFCESQDDSSFELTKRDVFFFYDFHIFNIFKIKLLCNILDELSRKNSKT